MLECLARLFDARATRPSVGCEKVELATRACGTLIIRPVTASLDVEDFRMVIRQVRDANSRSFSRIEFDFSRVQELVGPWGVHFAMLLQLAEQLNLPVFLSGLHGQPAALAWIFRNSPEVRALLRKQGLRDEVSPTGRRKVA